MTLKEILERNSTQPTNAYLTRKILHLNDDYKWFIEIYAFSIAFNNEDEDSQDNIAVTASVRNNPQTWLNGQLNDIVKHTEVGIILEQRKYIETRLTSKNLSILNYHPTIGHANEIRKQFFARIKELERLTMELYNESILTVAGYNIKNYGNEIKNAPGLQEMQDLYRPTNNSSSKILSF